MYFILIKLFEILFIYFFLLSFKGKAAKVAAIFA